MSSVLEDSPFQDIDSFAVPIEDQISKGLSFVKEFRETLGTFEAAVCDDGTEVWPCSSNFTGPSRQQSPTLPSIASQVWETGADPIGLHMSPPEKVFVPDLIK
jgi:hypothetical protein